MKIFKLIILLVLFLISLCIIFMFSCRENIAEIEFVYKYVKTPQVEDIMEDDLMNRRINGSINRFLKKHSLNKVLYQFKDKNASCDHSFSGVSNSIVNCKIQAVDKYNKIYVLQVKADSKKTAETIALFIFNEYQNSLNKRREIVLMKNLESAKKHYQKISIDEFSNIEKVIKNKIDETCLQIIQTNK